MNDVVKFLSENPVQYLATKGLDGKPKVRPFQFMLEDGGKLWFCTSNQKDVFAEIRETPYVELSTSSPAFQWIRLSGKAVFTEDLGIKNRIIAQNALVRSIYGSGANPIFEVFCLDEARAVLADFSGQPPRTLTL